MLFSMLLLILLHRARHQERRFKNKMAVKVVRTRHCFLLCLILTLELLILVLWTTRELQHAPSDMRLSKYDLYSLQNVTEPTTINFSMPINHRSKKYILSQPDCNQKLLIYQCTDNTRVCSGLGDRERGIVSTFLLALLTNRTFVVKHTRPCSLSYFFEPNVYNWSKCAHLDETLDDDTHYVEDIDGIYNLPELDTLEKGDIWKERNVFMVTNAILNTKVRSHPSVNDTIPWVFLGHREYITNLLFNVLFKLQDSLEKQIEDFINDITHNRTRLLVGLHIRRAFIWEQDVEYILDFMKMFSNESMYTIYLSTEDRDLREYALKQLPSGVSLNVSGVILNVNGLHATCDSFHYAIFEQQVLSRTDVLYKTKSEFSKLAYMIRGKTAKVYEFRRVEDKLVPHLLKADFPDPNDPIFTEP